MRIRATSVMCLALAFGSLTQMACGGQSDGGAGSYPLRLGHGGWRIHRAVLDPTGTKLAVAGDPPGGTAIWGVGVMPLASGVIQQQGQKGEFVGDATWLDPQTLVMTVGYVDEQQLATLDLRSGAMKIVTGLGKFGHGYDQGMAVSPDHHQVALTIGVAGAVTRTPSEVVVVNLTTGASRIAVANSPMHPRMPSWVSGNKLIYAVDADYGVEVEQMDLSTSVSTPLDTRGYRVYEVAADHGILLFNGLDPAGDQGLYTTRIESFAPRRSEVGSYSLPYIDGTLGLIAAVATGANATDAGEVIVDRIPRGT